MRQMIVIFIVLLLSTTIIAQDEGDISPELESFIGQVEIETESLRELESQADIILVFPTRADVIDFLNGQFDEYYTDEVIASDTAFYRAFGLIPNDYDLVSEIAALYGVQVAGYYDPETQSMNVILSSGEAPEDDLPFLDRVIFAHEYVHALQDQYFDLNNFYEEVEEDDNVDAILARQALVEGDATFIMNNYTRFVVENDPLSALADLGMQLASLGDAAMPAGTPHVIQQELTFPYLTGEGFVRAVYEEGGWSAVNALYTDNPPQSTEQILHPQRFLDGDMPRTVELADNSDALGDDWQVMDFGVFGEFYLLEWLFTSGMSRAERSAGAEGWGGDSYVVYQNGDDLAYELKIVWDNSDEAQEFYLETLLAFGDGLFELETASEYDMTEPFCWSGETALCIMIEDDATTIAHAPTEDSAMILLETD